MDAHDRRRPVPISLQPRCLAERTARTPCSPGAIGQEGFCNRHTSEWLSRQNVRSPWRVAS